MEGWDKFANGHVKLSSVFGWETATTTDAALVRLVYAETRAEYDAGGKSLQLALTVPQAEQLIRDLTTTLAAIEQRASSTDGRP